MSSELPRDAAQQDHSSETDARDRLQASAAAQRTASNSSDTAERNLWQGGYSAKAMYGTWAFSAVATVGLLVAVAVFGQGQEYAWPLAGAVILIWWSIAIGLYLYRRLSVKYQLTTQRFLHQAGILSRRTDRIEVIDIDDVSYTQGIIQRMLGVGSITITGSDRTHPELVLYGIDGVQTVAGLIDDVRREERRRRSLHIEAI